MSKGVVHMMRNGFFAFNGLCGGLGRGGIFMMLGGLLLLALFIVGIVALIRVLTSSHHPAVSGNAPPASNVPDVQNLGNALTILSERYARGEINEEEYAAKKANLRR